jgi:predicted HicB family RNase H-like nuclease
MATLTIRLPDDKHARLRQLAQQRKISLNKLMEELATVGLRLLDKLDAAGESYGS